ncbi:hypothetical protein PSECIP111951_00036 [Pseudoalteromonas holothuriae]|uniref:Nitrile hydratase alpha/Thiocyanate hydrolase gamma domain-containing protein n=1 Tax=Pseudoalteromonas holothuriae TaxID=2963714 RepID=A0ABM9GCR8_9GAMM|nr:nitrile hydratase subunit alpha [Pseudoalteromonas sp. CIP111951]CAH9049797.1 hypothetical protein PSECIP111951_00036 [Pseudoalteromonas sp. CIP111951]
MNNTPLNGDEPLLPALNLIYYWRTTWSRVIARAWADEEFNRLLMTDAKEAFKKMGYSGESNMPTEGMVDLWKLLDIEVVKPEESPNSQYLQPEGSTNGDALQYTHNGWHQAINEGLLKMKLTLTLPPKPEDDKWNALALGDYDAAGKMYPITGC